MAQNPRARIRVDLNQFKLHIALKEELEASLHFNSPSRQFYLSVIALVVHEMKKRGHITSIPLEEHLDLLALLNETVGGSAGSSEKEHLLPRIYRKWKGALPDLEDAPLFKVLGRKRDYDDGLGRTYPFTQAEKDTWANLFEYRGSEENVRLRFSIDTLGIGLDEVIITYGEDPELTNDAAWEAFIAGLHREAKETPEPASPVLGELKTPTAWQRTSRRLWHSRWRWPALAAVIALVVAFALWRYSWYAPHEKTASPENMAFPLPDKPSIAVLPFVNMSEDPKQEFFSDGMTDEIITCLSRVPYVLVIARNSTFSYKGKPVKICQVAEELGVRYVLEGSFRRTGDRVRVTAQLIDAIKGHHLWAERYERELKDVFALQDEITMEILRALEVKLTEGEQASPRRKGTDNLEAYLKVLQAVEYVGRGNRDDNLLARKMAEEALALDPEYARSYRVLAITRVMDIFYGTSKSPKSCVERALELAQKAISMDESDPCGYETLSFIYLIKRQHDRAIAEAERAIALDPNGADAYYRLGHALHYAGRAEEAIVSLEKAIRINPIAPATYFLNLGRSYRAAGRYEEAIGEFRKAINRTPDNFFAHFGLAATYSLAGREEEARAEVAEVLRIKPNTSLKGSERNLPYKNKADTDHLINAMRKAGLPETPPLPLPDKPSIAVLPFTNMTGGPEHEYLCDGITEQIITCLSKTPKLFVIARHSTFTYKGRPEKVQKVSRELGVRYVMEGSVHRSGDRIRITAQLIDAITGHHLWAERYDRDLKDVFALQDEITMEILRALEVKLTEGEQARIHRRGTNNLEAYIKTLKAIEYHERFNKDDMMVARRLCSEAIALDPEYARPYRVLSMTHMMEPFYGTSTSPKESFEYALELARKAISLDDSHPCGYEGLSYIYAVTRQYEKAIAEAERAVALDPNSADSHVALGYALQIACRPEEAIACIKKAIRSNPIAPGHYFRELGSAYRMVGLYEEAIAAYRKALARSPDSIITHVHLTATYSLTGRDHEAGAQAKEVLRIQPTFSVERYVKQIPYKDQSEKERLKQALRRAGLK
jgi:TolB-like protein/Tfp pilus assembly protein PilF